MAAGSWGDYRAREGDCLCNCYEWETGVEAKEKKRFLGIILGGKIIKIPV